METANENTDIPLGVDEKTASKELEKTNSLNISNVQMTSEARSKKEEARQRKRKLILESGGVRPRPKRDESKRLDKKSMKKKKKKNVSTTVKSTHFIKGGGGKVKLNTIETDTKDDDRKKIQKKNKNLSEGLESGRHRFGRVMDKVPCTNKPRFSTLSIAVPGSVVANCQTRELRTVVVGHIARAAAIYHVDEIVIFDDHLSTSTSSRNDRSFNRRKNSPHKYSGESHEVRKRHQSNQDSSYKLPQKESEPHTFMARILQYCECPQYLRRSFFPMHPDLQYAGLLHPLDAPHHVRAGEKSKYREGVVLEKSSPTNGKSFVNVGIFKTPVEINMALTAGIRCTVKLDVNTAYNDGLNQKKKQTVKGEVVSPTAPKEDDGTYWGYTTRLASSIKAVFDECPYDNGYDLKIGTSERGDVTVDDVDPPFQIPNFTHCLIVFGGVAGIEECVDADETFKISGKNARSLFDLWVNTCPFQGSRTIRTEEAVLVSLARLRPFVLQNEESSLPTETKIMTSQSDEHSLENEERNSSNFIEFSDESYSDESSARG